MLFVALGALVLFFELALGVIEFLELRFRRLTRRMKRRNLGLFGADLRLYSGKLRAK